MKAFVSLSLFLFSIGFNKHCDCFVISEPDFDDITDDNCPNVEFNVSESYKYITNEIRYNLCKKHYPKDFDRNPRDPTHEDDIRNKYLDCMGPECDMVAYKDPCKVECMFDHSISGEFYQDFSQSSQDTCNKHKCYKFKSDYSYDRRFISITDPKQKCGPNHYCDKQGCCKEPISPTKPPTTTTTRPTTTSTVPPMTHTTPASPRTTPSTRPTIHSTTTTTTTTATSRPTTKPTQTPSPSTQSTLMPSLEPFPKCEISGLFKYPNDQTNKKFYKCGLKALHVVCPLGEEFDPYLIGCKVPERTSTDTSTTTNTSPFDTISSTTTILPLTTRVIPDINWSRFLSCDKEGTFLNPFDCHKFYRCYQMEPFKKWYIDWFQCPDDDIFDQTMGNSSTCIPREQWETKFGHECTPKPLPDPTVYYLNCNEEGLFRNPYKCGSFYRCYRFGDQTMHLKEGSCVGDMLFDDTLGQASTCISREDYIKKFGDCKDKPLPNTLNNKMVFNKNH